jgi:hypothetical protein
VSPFSRSWVAVARFFVALALLLAPWPGLGRWFSGATGALVTTVGEPFFDSTNVTFVLRAPAPSENLGEFQGVIDVKRDYPEGPVRNAGRSTCGGPATFNWRRSWRSHSRGRHESADA